MKTITVQRVVLNEEERAIAKSWGRQWARMKADIRKHGGVVILTATWSGYSASQSRICHTEHVRWEHADDIVLKTIVFTDGTTLAIEVGRYTLEMIMREKVRRITQYDGLVSEARAALVETYSVGSHQEKAKECLSGDGCEPNAIAHEGACKFPVEQVEETGSIADRIKEEQMGNNWYDNM